MNHLGRLATAVLAASTAIACGQQSPSGSGASDRSVAWVLQIASEADFGVRVWLDGEAVYSQATPLAQSHKVEVERPYGVRVSL
jgi:hypothetical protein